MFEFRPPVRFPIGVVIVLIAQLVLPATATQPAAAQSTGTLFVYHQITNLRGRDRLPRLSRC